MPNRGWRVYRGYRIEVSKPDGGGWRVAVYSLKTDRPAPIRQSDLRYESYASAFAVGRTDVNWLLAQQK
jgi:hypothetical protein